MRQAARYVSIVINSRRNLIQLSFVTKLWPKYYAVRHAASMIEPLWWGPKVHGPDVASCYSSQVLNATIIHSQSDFDGQLTRLLACLSIPLLTTTGIHPEDERE